MKHPSLNVYYAPTLSAQQKAAAAVTVDDPIGLEQAIKAGAKVFTKGEDGKAVVHEACRHHSLQCLDVLWDMDPDVERWQAVSRWAAHEKLDAAVIHLMGKGAQPSFDWEPQELTLAQLNDTLAILDQRREELGIERSEEQQDDLLTLLPFLGQVKVVSTPDAAHSPTKPEAVALSRGAVLVFETPNASPTLWLSEALARRLTPALLDPPAPTTPRRSPGGLH